MEATSESGLHQPKHDKVRLRREWHNATIFRTRWIEQSNGFGKLSVNNHIMSEYLFIDVFGFDEYLFIPRLVSWLGVFNVLLVCVAGLLFLVRRVNRYAFSNQNAALKNTIKPLQKIHPYVGGILLVAAYIHGDLTFVNHVFQVHTGPLIWWILLVMMLLGTLGKKIRVKKWLTFHRGLAVLMIASVLLHLFARNLFG